MVLICFKVIPQFLHRQERLDAGEKMSIIVTLSSNTILKLEVKLLNLLILSLWFRHSSDKTLTVKNVFVSNEFVVITAIRIYLNFAVIDCDFLYYYLCNTRNESNTSSFTFLTMIFRRKLDLSRKPNRIKTVNYFRFVADLSECVRHMFLMTQK